MRRFSKLLMGVALIGGLAGPAAAEPPGASAADPAPGTAGASAARETAADPGTAADSAPEAIDPDARVDAYPGIIQKVTVDGIVVQRAGRPSDPRAPAYMAFLGKLGVPVEGQGKNSWLALRRGDVVMVSYVTGPPHRIVKVNVLQKPNRAQGMLLGPPPTSNQRRQRSFVGYVKKKDGDALIVMSPPAAPPGTQKAEVKAFVRTDDTRVELLRSSWDDLRKGDRVRIGHQKGNPRPIDVVQVIRRGGEEPLPPGLATRLFHPEYDKSVKDVDGIGETGPVPRPPRRLGRPIRIKGRTP